MSPQENNKISKDLELRLMKNVKDMFSFTKRKLGDTPTDDLALVNRKYVNLYGTTANRPSGARPGQQYFDTTIGRPIYLNPNSSVWTDGAGSVS